MDSQKFCLRWNNHQTNMLNVFGELLSKEDMVDVTLACDGASVKAHKVILSACSPFFHDIFMNNPCKHPVVILKDVKFSELQTIINFMYNGQVDVSQNDLSSLLKTAETLKVKGLADIDQANQSEGDRPSEHDLPNPSSQYSPQKTNESSLGKRQKQNYASSSQNVVPHKQHPGSNFPAIHRNVSPVLKIPLPSPSTQQEYIEDVKPILPELEPDLGMVKQQPPSPPLEILEPDYELDNDFVEHNANVVISYQTFRHFLVYHFVLRLLFVADGRLQTNKHGPQPKFSSVEFL